MSVSEIQRFRTAARKVAKLVEALAAGHIDGPTVSKAINKLDDRCNHPDIRGDETARTEAWATVSRLRTEKRDRADDAGFKARQAARQAEIDAITARMREENARLSPYERELRLMTMMNASRRPVSS